LPEEVTKKLTEYKVKWDGMEKNQKLRIILSIAVILASAIVAIVFVSNPNYTNLITATVIEIGQMSKTLTDAGIEHKVSDGNTTIVVKEKDLDAAQITLSQSGLITDGVKFQDSLDQITFSTTQSDKDKIYKEYYEAKLEEKLAKMDCIRNAVVTFTIPEKSVFFCNTIATESRKGSNAYSLTSLPPTFTEPFAASYNLGISCTNVVFAEPVEPIIPIVSPDLMCKLILLNVSSPLPVL